MKKICKLLVILIIFSSGCSQSESELTEAESETATEEHIHHDHSAHDHKHHHMHHPEDKYTVAAIVNGVEIKTDEIAGISLKKAIQDELLYQQAKKLGLDKSEGIDDRKQLIETYRTKIIEDSAEVSDDSIEAFYNRNINDYTNIVVRELLVRGERQIGEEVYIKADKGAELDAIYSEYEDKASVSIRNVVDPPYKHLFSTKEVGALELIENPDGFTIVRLTQKYVIPLTSLRKSISSRLAALSDDQKIELVTRDLLLSSNIKILSHGHHHQHHGHTPEIKASDIDTKEKFLKATKKCQEIPHSYKRIECFQPYFTALAEEKTAHYVLQLALSLEKDDIIRDCHMVAHHTGYTVLEQSNFDLETAFNNCSPECFQGCYHALMENYVSFAGWQPDEILQKSGEICTRFSGGDSIIQVQCYHGVGHGMLRNNYLPMDKAIEICRVLPLKSYTDSCVGGIFMEHANREILPFEEEEAIKRLPGICDLDLGEEFLVRKCARGIGEGVMFLTGYDPERSKELCGRLDEIQKNACIDSVTDMHTAVEQMRSEIR